jgi:hypothetical protein
MKMNKENRELYMARLHKTLVLFIALILTACSTATPTAIAVTETTLPPTATALQPSTNTPTPENTATPLPPTPTPTPVYPAEGYGPVNFPENIDPLTGLEVKDGTILDRRPVIIKVQNLPRADRPQWGLSAADIVYEYYTELGTTRFSVIYYGENAEQVAPIRSARLFDINLVRGYKAMFIFGSAYEGTYNRLVNSEFYQRLMLESSNTAGVIFRYDPNGKNYEMADTSKVNDYAKRMGIDNTRQNLDGMLFQMQIPAGGVDSPETYVRFSGAIYNRWDFDTKTLKYNRFVDTDNAINDASEIYVQLVDKANNEVIAAENVVMIFVRHTDIDSRPTVEVLDVSLLGTGKAYAMRDGKMYEVTWSRPTEQSVLTLLNADGSPFALRPGKTWVEVMSYNTVLEQQDDGAYRFKFISDW